MTAVSGFDFAFVSDLARRRAAIVLEPGKEYLVESRLGPLAKIEGFNSLNAFITAMRLSGASCPLQAKAVEALTTNETYFFRDFHPFESLRRTILPAIIERRADARQLSIWCAACSTGQEPYSIAMVIREHFPQLADWKIELIGTDLSPRVLAQAAAGRYNQIEINRGLPAPYLVKYFTQRDGNWFIKPEIAGMVRYQPMNLIEPWPILPACDLIFMRNVMIYFDVETKRTILQRLRGCLRPHGRLFLGSSETTLNIDPQWAPVTEGSTVVYRPNPPAVALSA